MCCLSCGSVWKVSVTDITKAKRQGLLQVTWKTMEAAVTKDRKAKSVTTSPFLLFNEMVQRLPLSWVPQSPAWSACWIETDIGVRIPLLLHYLHFYKLKFTWPFPRKCPEFLSPSRDPLSHRPSSSTAHGLTLTLSGAVGYLVAGECLTQDGLQRHRSKSSVITPGRRSSRINCKKSFILNFKAAEMDLGKWTWEAEPPKPVKKGWKWMCWSLRNAGDTQQSHISSWFGQVWVLEAARECNFCWLLRIQWNCGCKLQLS